MSTRTSRKPSKSNASEPTPSRRGQHHSVYVVFLRNPKGDGKAAYYVGMTGLTPEDRFQNHKNGRQGRPRRAKVWRAARAALYQHLNPMPYDEGEEMEVMLADSLRKRGYVVFGGH